MNAPRRHTDLAAEVATDHVALTLGGSVKTSVRYPDLGAIVYPVGIPDGVADELPALYNTLLSTVDWFETHDGSTPAGACILEHPRHVLLFCQAKDTVEILNKEFAIAPGDAERACRALFRAFPQARRIHLEVLFPPGEFRLPKRVLYGADHMVIDLPTTVDAYTASLGKNTRRHLRHNRTRIEEEHGALAVDTICPVTGADGLISTLVSWKNLRFNAKGVGHPLARRPIRRRLTWPSSRDVADVRGSPALRAHRRRSSSSSLSAHRCTSCNPLSIRSSCPTASACSRPTTSPAKPSGGLRSREPLSGVRRNTRRTLGHVPARHTGVRVSLSDRADALPWRGARGRRAHLRRNGQRYYWRARHAAGRTLRTVRPGRRDEPGKPRGHRE